MRRIKSLGLGAVMALALLAFPAGASATGGIEADAYPATLAAEGSGTLSYGAETSCQTILSASITGPIDKFAAKNTWYSCTGAPISANGCKLIFHPGSENSVDIGPAGCGPITFPVGAVCTGTIGAHSGLPATYTNLGSGSKATVRIDVDFTVTYTLSGSNCAEKGKSFPAEYEGTWNLRGLNAAGMQIGIHTTDSGDLGAEGFFVAGKASEVKAEQPRFEAKTYPATVSGTQDAKKKVRLVFGNELECKETTFGATMPTSTSVLATDAKLSGCTILATGSVVTVAMNGCYVAFGVANAGPPYSGETELACGKEKALVLTWSLGFLGKCTLTFPAQSLGDISYENLGTGSSRTVAAGLEGTGIEYSWVQTGIGCGKQTATGSAEAELVGEVDFKTLN